MSNYTDVSEYTPNWNPRTTGSTKENNLVQLTAGEDSWAEGFYLGSREAEIKGKKYTIHKMKIIAVGNPTHLGAPIEEGGTIYEFFGTSVVSGMLQEKITPGMCIKVQWFGKVQPKTAGGEPYHNWKVYINNSVQAIAVQNGVIVADGGSSYNDVESNTGNQQPENKPQATGNTAGEVVTEDDDDLPF